MNIFFIVIVCFLTCIGQLFQKKAALDWHQKKESGLDKFRNKWFLFALFTLGLGLVIWLNVLRWVPLNIAYPMLSLNFVFVALASHFWFGERACWREWLGIMLIVVGVVMLGVRL